MPTARLGAGSGPALLLLLRAPAVLLPALCLLLPACTPQKVATPSRSLLSKPEEGHVYLAQLMPVHPLWPAAKRLAAELERLRRPLLPMEISAGWTWDTPTLLGPAPWAYPQTALRRDWLEWRQGLAAPVSTPDATLPADLQAARLWRYRQIELEQARRLLEAQSLESRRLAQFREQLVREHLDELTNAGLDLSVPPAEARQKGAETVERIWTHIEAMVARAEAESTQKRLPAVEAQLAEEARRRRAEVDAEIEAEAAARRERETPPLVEPQRGFQQRLEKFVERSPEEPGPQQLAGTTPEAGDLVAAQQAYYRAQAEYHQARQRQLTRLENSQARLVRAILADLRLAALRTAYEKNLRLSLVPPGSPQGADLTELVRRRLQQIWSAKDSR